MVLHMTANEYSTTYLDVVWILSAPVDVVILDKEW